MVWHRHVSTAVPDVRQQSGLTQRLRREHNTGTAQCKEFKEFKEFNRRKTGTRLAPAHPRKQKSQQALTC